MRLIRNEHHKKLRVPIRDLLVIFQIFATLLPCLGDVLGLEDTTFRISHDYLLPPRAMTEAIFARRLTFHGSRASGG
jgi:hypothetical protein